MLKNMTVGKGVMYFLFLILGLNALGIVTGLLSGPFKLAGTVVSQVNKTSQGLVKEIINPDQAIRSYRAVHGYYTAIQAKKGQIMLAKQAVEMASEGRKDARRTEMIGLQQGCLNDVERYNELTRRTDTRIYTNPEEFLPDSWSGERQILPESFDQSLCMGK